MKQWTVTHADAPWREDPTIYYAAETALHVATLNGGTIFFRNDEHQRWVRARLQPENADAKARREAQMQHDDEVRHPRSPLARSIHFSLESWGGCKPGQCSHIAVGLLQQGWPADPKAPAIRHKPSNHADSPLAFDVNHWAGADPNHVIIAPPVPDLEHIRQERLAAETVGYATAGRADGANFTTVKPDRPEVQCPMPHCLESLALQYDTAYTLGPGDLTNLPGGPEDAHTQTWTIECQGGHVILLPEDTAEDHYDFTAADLVRLKATLRIAEMESQLAWFHRNDAEQAVYDARTRARENSNG